MLTAVMHGYNQPLVLEEVPTPDIGPQEVLVKVEAGGMCRTDVQLHRLLDEDQALVGASGCGQSLQRDK